MLLVGLTQMGVGGLGSRSKYLCRSDPETQSWVNMGGEWMGRRRRGAHQKDFQLKVEWGKKAGNTRPVLYAVAMIPISECSRSSMACLKMGLTHSTKPLYTQRLTACLFSQSSPHSKSYDGRLEIPSVVFPPTCDQRVTLWWQTLSASVVTVSISSRNFGIQILRI